MAITHEMPPHPVVVGDALMLRVLHDFDKVPTLRLTLAEAMRRWDLDRRTCQKLLDTLVASRLLETNASGWYVRSQATAADWW